MGKNLNIVVVGLRFGAHIVDGLMKESAKGSRVRLAGVCDADPARLESVATKCGLARYGSLDEVLADGSVQAVGLFTGPVGRAALLRRIIKAGKDVMTTKPLRIIEAMKRSAATNAAVPCRRPMENWQRGE